MENSQKVTQMIWFLSNYTPCSKNYIKNWKYVYYYIPLSLLYNVISAVHHFWGERWWNHTRRASYGMPLKKMLDEQMLNLLSPDVNLLFYLCRMEAVWSAGLQWPLGFRYLSKRISSKKNAVKDRRYQCMKMTPCWEVSHAEPRRPTLKICKDRSQRVSSFFASFCEERHVSAVFCPHIIHERTEKAHKLPTLWKINK